MKILIHAINGTGLGHVIRTRRIAEAFKKLQPEAQIVFVTNSKYYESLKKDYKVYALRKDEGGILEGRSSYGEYLQYNEMALTKIILHELPDVVLFDLEFTQELLYLCRMNSIRMVYVLRNTVSKRFSSIKKWFSFFDAIIVPHEERDVLPDQKEILLGSPAVFVGPIVDLRDYPEGNKRKNILITLGSGAGHAQNRPLFSAVDSFLGFLRKNNSWTKRYGVDVDIVTGPFYEGGCDLSGFTARSTTENLAQDMYESKVVISAAGYNTVNEIVITRTPAALVPLPRGGDDQFQRAANLAKQGCVRVAGQDIAACVEELLENWDIYHNNFPDIKSGNDRAAEILANVLAAGKEP